MGTLNLAPELAYAADKLMSELLVVRSGEEVLITADTATDEGVVAAVMSAAKRSGARPTVLVIPRLPLQGLLADPFVPEPVGHAAGACDAWMDLTWPYLAGSTASDHALAPGRVRYALGGDLGRESFVRLFARDDLQQVHALCDAFAELLVPGTPCRFTNDQGGDVEFRLGEADPAPMRATQPGMFFMPGSVVLAPDESTVKGLIPLDAVFHEHYTRPRSTIMLEVDGKIQRVTGGDEDGLILERALRRAAGGSDLGHIIHFTCGVHPGARYTGDSFIEDSRVFGYNAIGMGRPFWAEGGGENHPDGVMVRTSLWVDGEQIVRDGTIVAPAALADAAAALSSGSPAAANAERPLSSAA